MPAFVRTSGMIYMVLNSYMFYGQNGGVLKKILRRIGILLAVLLVVCIGYVIYVMVAYYRLPDNQHSLRIVLPLQRGRRTGL